MKTSKKVISLLLSVIMVMTTFVVAMPLMKIDAEAISIGGITQQRVVGVADPANPTYPDTYAKYAMDFLRGASEPTDIVIPGLSSTDDFVVQGLSYYKAQDWIMVSVYHKTGAKPSMIFALSAATGDFEAAFAIYNVGNVGVSSPNYDHGGGLAFSANNFYYSGDDSDKDDGDTVADANCIAYAPLSQFDNPVDTNNDKIYEITLQGQIKLYEMGDAATAYVCYDDGILWAGNFYEDSIGAGNYNAPVTTNPVLYNTMIYGYKLYEDVGGTQAERSKNEWDYLTGDKGNSTDHAGVPSHCIAVHTDIEDVQYAIVDKGRLYLSRSWGTGKNDETIASVVGSIGKTPDYSTLTVADIDLSVEGDIKIVHNTSTGTREANAHFIDEYENYDLMPMSEGLCFIDDCLYISFEGASNKYMNEYAWSLSNLTNTGNCDYPIDVVWKLDPYALFGEKRASSEESAYYEKVSDLSQIRSGEEYIILYESAERDPVTQNPILYLLDSHGGFKGNKLSKRDDANSNGYIGALGYKLTQYSKVKAGTIDEAGEVERDRIYFYDWQKDDVENVRWRLTKIGDVEGNAEADYFRIECPEFYFANNSRFYCDASSVCMASDKVLGVNKMAIHENAASDGGFWIANDLKYFLWCNDGVSGNSNGLYSNKINQFYANSTVPMYSGLTERAGTFHVNATNVAPGNIIGAEINSAGGYAHRTFYIYKRVVNTYASTFETSVYTDMNAELQEDGTYTVNLETYAIAPTHYSVAAQRPTDYIFALDTSTSMDTGDVYDYVGYSGELNLRTLAGGKEASADPEKPNVLHVYDFSTYEHYYKLGDDYRPIRLAIRTTKREWKVVAWPPGLQIQQYYWAYVVGEDGKVYVLHENPTDPNNPFKYVADKAEFYRIIKSGTEDEFIATCSAGSDKQNNNDGDARCDTVLYNGPYYKLEYSGTPRLEYMKTVAKNIADGIKSNAESTGLDHRIAITQFGSWNTNSWHNTGLYTGGSTSLVKYSTSTDATLDTTITSDQFANAFFNMNQIDTVKGIVDVLSTSGGDGGAFSNFSFSMANKIIENSNQNYLATGDRSVAIIMLSSGIPGINNGETEANNVAATAITEASKAKLVNGASIYTIKIGNGTLGSFPSNIYMNALSSNYISAKSLKDLGDKNPNGIEYSLSIPSAADNAIGFLINDLMHSTERSGTAGLTYLQADTIIREELTEAFIVPQEADAVTMKAYYLPGIYDKIGRFSFGDPTEVAVERKNRYEARTSETDPLYLYYNGTENSRLLEVWGYDYNREYISASHPGNKLRITITGLLADENAKITNTSINNTSTTAVYKDPSWINPSSGSPRAFKFFPSEYFNIPEYTYVLDYGIPMYDYDVNGTLKSVSADLSAQRDANGNLAYKSESENGLVEITNNNLDLLYTTTPTNFTDSGYCLIQRDDGTYDWFEIKVVPASNVLFEESSMVNGASKANSAAWSAVTDGSPVKPYQSLTNDKTDVYGYDEAYAQTEHCYSNGGAYKAEVNASQNRSVTKTFDFVGDRFDLISACGPNTGIMVVKVSGGSLERPKTFIVDTYYRPEGENANLANTNGLICQTPIVSFSGERGTYTVEATAAYLSTAKALNKSITGTTSKGKLEATTGVPVTQADAKTLLAELGMADLANSDIELVWFDDNSVLNGGSGAKGNINTRGAKADGSATKSLDCYLDGFRIYHPVSAEDIEYIESEQNAQYVNVIDCIKKGQIGTDGSASFSGIAYVEKALEGLAFANYNQVGPQNELYLKGGSTSDALVLKVNVAPNGKVHLGLRAVTGTAQVKIGVGTEEAGTAKTFTINGATEMYYDVTSYADIKEGIATITIQNTGSGVLAVNNIKLTGDNTMNLVTADDMDSAIALMNAPAEKAEVINGVVTPIVEDTDNDTDVDNGTDNDTDTDNENTGDAGSDSGSSNLSFIEQLIAMIMEILSSIFQFLPVGGVA